MKKNLKLEKMRHYGILPAFALMIAASACSKVDEMHDSTVNMDKTTTTMANDTTELKREMKETSSTTQHMDATTSELLAQTKDLKGLTTELRGQTIELKQQTQAMYIDLRQGDALGHRQDAIRDLERHDKIEAKLKDAGFYMMAFEFQLWKDALKDDQKRLEMLYFSAMEEFFKTVQGYMDGKDSLDSTSSDERLSSLMAISAAMHLVNHNKEIEAENSTNEVSMLSLIESTLAKKADIQSGKIAIDSLKAYEREIFFNEREAVYLLRLRQNFLPMVTLCRLTGINNAGMMSRAWDYLFGIEAKISEINPVELQLSADWLRQGNDVTDFLKSAGYEPMIHNRVARLYRKLEITDAKEILVQGENNPQVKTLQALSKEIERFRSNAAPEPASRPSAAPAATSRPSAEPSATPSPSPSARPREAWENHTGGA